MSENVLARDTFSDAGVDANTEALKRRQMPEDLTGAMIFLTLADGDFMTGQCVVVDGGSVIINGYSAEPRKLSFRPRLSLAVHRSDQRSNQALLKFPSHAAPIRGYRRQGGTVCAPKSLAEREYWFLPAPVN